MSDPLHIDGQKLHFHPRRVADLIDGRDDWEKAKSLYPIYIEISPCGACNHRCTFCSISYIGYKTIMLDPKIVADRLQEMGELGVKSCMWAGEGEPMLNKHINAMVSYAHASGIDSSFTTNGVLLNKLDLTYVAWVKVSLNAGTRETYEKVHQTQGKDWDSVWANIKDAAKRKGNCTIGVQTLLLPENFDEMLTLARLCKEAGADYLVIKPYSQHKFSLDHTRQYEHVKYQHFQHQMLREALAEFESPSFNVVFRAESMKAVSEPIPYSKCLATPFTWAYWMSSGDLYSCSAYLLDDRFNLGNLNTSGFKEIWQGERRRKNWEFVRNELSITECRQSCRQNSVNKYLTELVEGAPHRNFI